MDTATSVVKAWGGMGTGCREAKGGGMGNISNIVNNKKGTQPQLWGYPAEVNMSPQEGVWQAP